MKQITSIEYDYGRRVSKKYLKDIDRYRVTEKSTMQSYQQMQWYSGCLINNWDTPFNN